MSNGKDVTAILKDWRFSKEHVDQSINSGRFISSKTILLVAINNMDKIMKAAAGGYDALRAAARQIQGTPIGVITNWSINQQKQLQQLFEIGSSIPYFIPGNVMNSGLSISRVIYSGGTILGNLYNFGASGSDAPSQEDREEAGFEVPAGTDEGMKNQWFAINLAAKAFDRPTTLLWLMKNNYNQQVGSYLFKNAYIEAHAISSDSTSIIIMENCTMRFESAYPVSANSIS